MDLVKVKILLLQRNITQMDIARECGISPAAITYILSGQRPGYRYRARIARMLGVKVGDLFGRIKPKRKRTTSRGKSPKMKKPIGSVPQEQSL